MRFKQGDRVRFTFLPTPSPDVDLKRIYVVAEVLGLDKNMIALEGVQGLYMDKIFNLETPIEVGDATPLIEAASEATSPVFKKGDKVCFIKQPPGQRQRIRMYGVVYTVAEILGINADILTLEEIEGAGFRQTFFVLAEEYEAAISKDLLCQCGHPRKDHDYDGDETDCFCYGGLSFYEPKCECTSFKVCPEDPSQVASEATSPCGDFINSDRDASNEHDAFWYRVVWALGEMQEQILRKYIKDPVWKSFNGRVTTVTRMTDNHLRNAIKMLQRARQETGEPYPPEYQAMLDEEALRYQLRQVHRG